MSISQAVILQALGCQMTFSRMIEDIREKQGLSRVGFANKLGISAQRLNNIEQGKARVLPKHAAHFAKVLGYPEDQFVRLALQDMIDKDGLSYHVNLEKKSGA